MSFNFDKLSVLVVEDIAPLRELIGSVLKGFGIKNVTLAANGKEAFKFFCRHNHDIILTDWAMEPMDGIDLTKAVRNQSESPNRTVPIVIVTGYNAWPRVEIARDAGANEFLIKPFSASDIAKRISHVITHPRDFVEIPDFFGPDRRRKQDPNYAGRLKRESDQKDYSSKGD